MTEAILDHAITNLDQVIERLHQIGFDSRPSQNAMMEAVQAAFKQRQIQVIEGGTGIGKTFAYLIPALLQLSKDTKLVIATATVNLQEQLLTKDLPEVEKILNRPTKAALAKGRRRYICLSKLFQRFDGTAEQAELDLFGIPAAAVQSGAHRQQDKVVLGRLVDAFEKEHWSGDRDQLSFSVEHGLWAQLTTDAAGCSNRKCAYFKECPYFIGKKHLQQAEVIITNHDLLLSDINLGTGVLLPKAENCLYIIDEAHHFPEKAVEHFSVSSALTASREWLEYSDRLIRQSQDKKLLSESQAEKAIEAQKALLALLPQMQTYLAAHYDAAQREDCWLLDSVPEVLADWTKQCQSVSERLRKYFMLARQQLNERYTEQSLPEYDQFMAAFSITLQRLERFWRTWLLFNYPIEPNQPPIARWFTRREGTRYQPNLTDYECHCAMISASAMLPSYFWQQLQQGAILCSATIKALGKFDDFMEKMGLLGQSNAKTAAYDSPFAYQDSQLCIPMMQAQPVGQQNQAHIDEVIQLLPDLLRLEAAGVLVLFTSRRMMEVVFDAMPIELHSRILFQGNLPKTEIIQQHKHRVDKGEPSVIFGLQSFAEGVDLPGDYCRHVVITKLPFSVPSTPIERVWVKWLTDLGRNPFMEHSLPKASLRLTQQVGRLIRRIGDEGKVTILDRRLVSKFYGKQLIENLPKFKIEAELQQKNC